MLSSIFTNVLLPAPLGPNRPKICPWGTFRETPRSASTPPRYFFLVPSILITVSDTALIKHHLHKIASSDLLEAATDPSIP